jgi:phage terminase large subunit-like protein
MSEEVSLRLRARAQLELRQREEKRRLGPRYDWYGDECACGKPLGTCREHPRARPDQRPPGTHRSSNDRPDWRIWVYLAGRGTGKTRSFAEFVNREVEKGHVAWVALINETVKDVRDVQIEGPSGLLRTAPPWFRPVYEPSKARVTWPNGAIATIYSAEQPEALRGPEFGLGWLDEIGKWQRGQQEVWDNVQMCLRAVVEPRPRLAVSSTPRPTPTFKAILKDTRAVVTRARTLDNAAHLDPDFLAYIMDKYGGTRLGRQELDAELLEDTPGALWTTGTLDGNRVKEIPRDVGLARVVIGVDPGAGSADPDSGAETGIVVGARGTDRLGYLLEDCSLKSSPAGWAAEVLRAYARHKADCIVVERNNGGAMVEHTIRTIPSGGDHPSGFDVPIKTVWASRGKATRAEPIASLAERGRIRHVGVFNALETQLTEWLPGDDSPDRLDAYVWAFTELFPDQIGESGTVVVGGRRPDYGTAGGLASGTGFRGTAGVDPRR